MENTNAEISIPNEFQHAKKPFWPPNFESTIKHLKNSKALAGGESAPSFEM